MRRWPMLRVQDSLREDVKPRCFDEGRLLLNGGPDAQAVPVDAGIQGRCQVTSRPGCLEKVSGVSSLGIESLRLF